MTVLLSTLAMANHAQTIGDYSRAQASALERAVAQAIDRPVASSSGSTAGASSAPAPARVTPPDPRRPDADAHETPGHAAPVLLVSGTFTSKDRAIAEVSVDGVPFWLSEGDAIPGSPWVVHRIAMDRVELTMLAATKSAHPVADPGVAKRVFRLPSAR